MVPVAACQHAPEDAGFRTVTATARWCPGCGSIPETTSEILSWLAM